MKKLIIAAVAFGSIASAYAADPVLTAHASDPKVAAHADDTVVQANKWSVKCYGSGSLTWEDVSEPKNANGGFTFRTKDSEIQTTAGMNCVAVGTFKKEG